MAVHVNRIGRRSRRVLAALAALAVLAGLLAAPGRAAHAAPPPNPSDGQIQSAAQQKAALADEVGRLSAQVASMQTQLQQLQAAQELAEQKYVYALSKLQVARAAAQAARAREQQAQRRVDEAQTQFREYAQATYMAGDIGGTTGSLLTAADPSNLLEQNALQNYESSHQLDAIGNMQSATVAKSNADAAARKAVTTQAQATAVADQAKRDADAAVIAARAQAKQLQATLNSSQASLQQAQEKLATLNHQRTAFLAYQAHQRALAAARARARAIAEARARAAAAAAAARAAAQAARQQNSGGGGGGGGISFGPTPSPTGGSWSAAKGSASVARAEQYLGWMYAWAGGNASGPTYGVCAGDGAFNDCHVLGFDCSGLTMFGWAPFLSLSHYAAAQYIEAGSYHPSTGSLMPGDLVFWSSDGSIGGIHHVAIYVGGGNVIQAPQSGSVIQITPLDQVSWGYFGATRPLT